MQAGALTYLVPTGRRDGRVSLASDAANLPGFTDSVEVQKQKFAAKGLSTQDLVTLVGEHYEFNIRLNTFAHYTSLLMI